MTFNPKQLSIKPVPPKGQYDTEGQIGDISSGTDGIDEFIYAKSPNGWCQTLVSLMTPYVYDASVWTVPYNAITHVEVEGYWTTWREGITEVSISHDGVYTGVSVSNLVVTDMTHLSFDLTTDHISAGYVYIDITTGPEVMLGTDNYSITVGMPSLLPDFTGAGPSTGNSGYAGFRNGFVYNLNILGRNTNFDGTTTVTLDHSGLYTDITISNIDVTDNTHLTFDLDLTSNTAQGAIKFIITTGTEVVNATFGDKMAFNMNGWAYAGGDLARGSTNNWLWMYSSLGGGDPYPGKNVGASGIAISGTGITIHDVVNADGVLRFQVDIASDAPLGARDVTIIGHDNNGLLTTSWTGPAVLTVTV